MKIRNTTDYDTAALRSLFRKVVREVEATLTREHPLGWMPVKTHARAERILTESNVWVRRRTSTRKVRALLAEATDLRAWHADETRERPTWATREGLLHLAQEREREAERIQHRTSGHAYLSGHATTLSLSSDGDATRAVWLFRHEVWHLFGLRHQHFPDAIMHETTSAFAAVREVYGIAEGATLPLALVPSKAALPTAEERATKALVEIEAKAKRWTTKLRRAQTALGKLKRQSAYHTRQMAQAASRKSKNTD